MRTGLDVIAADSIHLVRGKRIGLLTNQSGVDRYGTSGVEILLDVGLDLTTLFSPEHGFRGVLDQRIVGHSTDSATGLPIFSLYGERREPTPDMFDAVDVLLIDLQDIGARPYTYISTTLNAMRVAGDVGVETIILDRPNPIGGAIVQGPTLDLRFSSFVGMLPVPMRHGLTIGELALFGNDVLGVGASVRVIPASGWRREMWFDATELPWIRPSPNMPSLESATHYPGTVLFEATNLSVGRGTPIAFQVLGAPWLEPAAVMGGLPPMPGVAVTDTTFRPVQPSDSKYADTLLAGIKLRVTDRETYDPVMTAVAIFQAVRRVHGEMLVLREAALDRLTGSDRLRRDDWGGAHPWEAWRGELDDFRAQRGPFLLYPT